MHSPKESKIKPKPIISSHWSVRECLSKNTAYKRSDQYNLESESRSFMGSRVEEIFYNKNDSQEYRPY